MEENPNNNNINNSNNNNDNIVNLENGIISMSIDIKQLEKLQYYELYKIAHSLKLSTVGRRIDILTKIKKFHQSNSNKINNYNNYNNNIRSYNNTCYDLKIKEIDNSELLFWKIVKNKYLFKIIISKLSTSRQASSSTSSIEGIGYNEYTKSKKNYYEAVEIDWMIKNGHKELLKDKIRCGQFLLFPRIQDTQVTCLSYCTLIPIFKFIKYDKEFYQLLFKRHWNRMKNIKESINDLLSTGCLGALQVLIEDTPKLYVPNTFTLIGSVKYNKYKITKYLCGIEDIMSTTSTQSQQLPIHSQEFKIQIWKLIFNTPVTMIIKRFKLLNYLIEESPLNLTTPQDQPLYLVNLFRLCPFENNFTIKVLIESCKSIVNLDLYTILKSINNNNCSNNNKISKTELDSFNINLTKQQLKSVITNESILQDSSTKQIVKRLLNMYYSIINQKNHKFNLYYGDDGNETNTGSKIDTLKNADIDSLEYGDSKLLKRWFNKNDYSGLDYNRFALENRVALIYNDPKMDCSNGGIYNGNLVLFKNCKDNRVRQIKFINDVIRDCKDLSINQECKLSPLFFFNLVIATDDLDHVKLVFNAFGNELLIVPEKNYSKFNYNILRYVQSIPVMEYLIDNIKNKQLLSILTLFRYGKVDLLPIFENRLILNQLGNDGSEVVQNKLRFTTMYNLSNQLPLSNSGILKTAAYIISKPNIYEYDSYVVNCWAGGIGGVLNGCNVWDTFDISDIKFIIENTSFDYDFFKKHSNLIYPCTSTATTTNLINETTIDSNYNICGFEPFSNTQIKLMDWIFTNRIHDLVSRRCKISNSILKVFLYLTGRGYQLFEKDSLLKYMGSGSGDGKKDKISVFSDCDLLLYHVVKRGDFNFIDQFMETYFTMFQRIETQFIEKMVFDTPPPPFKDSPPPVKSISNSSSKDKSIEIVSSILDSIVYSIIKCKKSSTTADIEMKENTLATPLEIVKSIIDSITETSVNIIGNKKLTTIDIEMKENSIITTPIEIVTSTLDPSIINGSNNSADIEMNETAVTTSTLKSAEIVSSIVTSPIITTADIEMKDNTITNTTPPTDTTLKSTPTEIVSSILDSITTITNSNKKSTETTATVIEMNDNTITTTPTDTTLKSTPTEIVSSILDSIINSTIITSNKKSTAPTAPTDIEMKDNTITTTTTTYSKPTPTEIVTSILDSIINSSINNAKPTPTQIVTSIIRSSVRKSKKNLKRKLNEEKEKQEKKKAKKTKRKTSEEKEKEKKEKKEKQDKQDQKELKEKEKKEKQDKKELKEKEKKEKQDKKELKEKEKKEKQDKQDQKELEKKLKRDRQQTEKEDKKRNRKKVKTEPILPPKPTTTGDGKKRDISELQLIPLKKVIQLKTQERKEISDVQVQFLLSFVTIVAKLGRFDLLLYLDQQYPVLFLTKQMKKDSIYDDTLNSIFTKTELKILLKESLTNDHLEQFNYLTIDDRTTITNKQFYKISIPTGIVYQNHKDKYEHVNKK